MRVRADFQWRLAEIDGHRAVLIVDNDMGSMSVTNDVEAVLANINQKMLREIDAETLVFYRDSMGQWDRIVTDMGGEFQSFAALGSALRERLANAWGSN